MIAPGLGLAEVLIVAVIMVMQLGIPAAFVVYAVAKRPVLSPEPPLEPAIPPSIQDATSWSDVWVKALLVASVWPLVYIPLFLAFVFATNSSDQMIGVAFSTLICLHFLTFIAGMASQVACIVVAATSTLPVSSKVFWILALVLVSMLAPPFAFYFLVWKPRSQAGRQLGHGEPALPRTAPVRENRAAAAQEMRRR